MSSEGLAVVCTSVLLAKVPSARPQDATSVNLPEHVENGGAMPMPILKKKKNAESKREIAAGKSSQKRALATEEMPPPEELRIPAAPVEKKARVKKRTTSPVQSEAASSSIPTQLSLPAAQAMAMSAPLPEYPYQAKRANITGSGICVMTIDTASGKVTDAMMAQSTGDVMLDKVTTNTFRRWRFKPGTVSQVRVPVDYE